MNWHVNLRPALAALCAGALTALITFAPAAHAGRQCEQTTVGAQQTSAAFEAALRLQTLLNTGNQKAVIIARRGQDLEKYGITFSHAAFAIKDRDGKGWSVYHDLNICGSDVSQLYEQGLAEFFADDLLSTQIAIAIPEPWLQDRLVQLLNNPAERARMHTKKYSAVAYPFARKYQNSNGWLLETYARAASDDLLGDREDAQNWLKRQRYTPSVLHLGPMTRLGGRMFKANVAFDDHPGELRWNDSITANTADDVMRFVAKNSIPQPQCPHGAFPVAVCIVQ
jgi:hypothetical protein